MRRTFKAIITSYSSASYRITARDGDGHRVHSDRHDSLPLERQHMDAARKLVRVHWKNSPEVLDPTRYELVGGWVKAGTYAWVVIDVREGGSNEKV